MPTAHRSLAPARLLCCALALAAPLPACSRPQPATSAAPASQAAPTPQDSPATPTASARPENPGLPVGSAVPTASLLDESGTPVSLASLHADQPVIVTFYRGGWCPFCTKALAQWHDRMPDVRAAGAIFVAITPERPDLAAATRAKIPGADYRVLSDHTMAAARAFNVAFRMDDATQAKYRTYGIDLSRHNAVGQWDLPAPATFVLDRQGRVRYAFASWDYRQRADPNEVLAVARQLR